MIESDGREAAALHAQRGRRDDRRRRPDLAWACSPRPGEWGADIVVGTTQPLGVHMNGGGGVGGFIASRDEERYAREYPTLQVSIAETTEPGERRLRRDPVRADLLRVA